MAEIAKDKLDFGNPDFFWRLETTSGSLLIAREYIAPPPKMKPLSWVTPEKVVDYLQQAVDLLDAIYDLLPIPRTCKSCGGKLTNPTCTRTGKTSTPCAMQIRRPGRKNMGRGENEAGRVQALQQRGICLA